MREKPPAKRGGFTAEAVSLNFIRLTIRAKAKL